MYRVLPDLFLFVHVNAFGGLLFGRHFLFCI